MPWKMQLAAACPAEPFRKSQAFEGKKPRRSEKTTKLGWRLSKESGIRNLNDANIYGIYVSCSFLKLGGVIPRSLSTKMSESMAVVGGVEKVMGENPGKKKPCVHGSVSRKGTLFAMAKNNTCKWCFDVIFQYVVVVGICLKKTNISFMQHKYMSIGWGISWKQRVQLFWKSS